MSLEAAVVVPTRATLVNMRTGEELEVLYNPTDVARELSVEYARRVVPGMSHEPLQYSHTKNETYSFLLYCVGLGRDGQEAIADFDRFLSSLCVPSSTAQDVITGGPADLLIVWPEFLSLRCRVTGLRFKYTSFATDGAPTRFSAEVTLEEYRTGRLTSEDVRRNGLRRASRTPRDA